MAAFFTFRPEGGRIAAAGDLPAAASIILDVPFGKVPRRRPFLQWQASGDGRPASRWVRATASADPPS